MKKTIALAISALLAFQTASADILIPQTWHNLVVGVENGESSRNSDSATLLSEAIIDSLVGFDSPANQVETLIGHDVKDYAVEGWWHKTIENISKYHKDMVFFSFSGDMNDQGLIISTEPKLSLIKYKKLLEWFKDATEKAEVMVALDSCSNIDVLLSAFSDDFHNHLIVFKPEECTNEMSVTENGKQYGVVSYLLSQVFLGKVLNDKGLPIRTAGEIKDYMIKEAEERGYKVSVYGGYNENKDLLPKYIEHECRYFQTKDGRTISPASCY